MRRFFFTFALLGYLGIPCVNADSSPEPTTPSFRVATYNLENWLRMERNRQPDQPKPAESKEAIWTILAEIRPDVLGLQEVGTTNDLAEIADGLAQRGLTYPYSEWIQGVDTNRHVALLSRFPISARFSRTDYVFMLGTNSHSVQRGILDVAIEVHDRYFFRALVVHLKSRREVPEFDQAEMRLKEAQTLRAHISKALKEQPDLNLLVMGDFNDVPDSQPIRTIVGEAPFALHILPARTRAGRTGTHLWRARREWSRIDYIIVSPGMYPEFVPNSARIGEHPLSEQASDHRPVWADFFAEDRPPPVNTSSGESAEPQPALTETRPEH
ncbi:MAG: endonuclease/exonuclease/phosphatase family protein [Verrucomicrobiae bacterium]|nr:endonuclease/exonuclease/phosphatase family protein [Verrucomicrobiae bacterium]